MKLKPSLITLLASTLLAQAGTEPAIQTAPAEGSVFDNALRPISNPTLFDLPLARTQIHAIYMNHQFPGSIELANGGGDLPLGGEANIVAVQFEYALSDTFSIVAAKDGYAKVNFDNTLNDADGFANIGAGVKWVFHKNEATGYAAALTTTVEFPTGNTDIFQGMGDGLVNVMVSNLKIADRWQFASNIGIQVPFDNDVQATMGFASAHASYRVTDWFVPLIEMNWFHVLDPADQGLRFNGQAGGAVPNLVGFEGGDLFNIGAANSGENRDFVTLAIGARFPINDMLTLGAAYEFPLTDNENSLMEDRITIDAVIRF